VKIEALGERRGPATEAGALYTMLTDHGGATMGAGERGTTPVPRA
jgi:hypothetical protein